MFSYLNEMSRATMMMFIERLNYLLPEQRRSTRSAAEDYIMHLYECKEINDYQFKDLWECIH